MKKTKNTVLDLRESKKDAPKELKLTILLIFLFLVILGTVIYFVITKVYTKNNNKLTKMPTVEMGDSSNDLSEIAFDQEAVVKGDPFGDKNGPFYHKVYKAISSDGINFTDTGELIADKSSVPDVVKLPDGRLIIYAVDGALRSKSGLMLSLSEDDGKTWKSGSVKIKSKSGLNGAADPQAVLLEDGSIRLFYLIFSDKKPPLDETGKPIPTGDKQKIKSAISKDGVNFTEEEGSRLETVEILTDPDVVKIGSKWFMYLSKGLENIAFTSSDGISFKEEKSIRPDGAISKTVSIGNGSYRQFYCKEGISSAITKDGLTFTNEIVSLVGPKDAIICDPTPVKVGNEWLMFYKNAPFNANFEKKDKIPLE